MTKTELETRLKARLNKPVFITLTRNRVRMITTRYRHGAWELRLHETFCEAPDDVINELASWIKMPKSAVVPQMREFISKIPVNGNIPAKPEYLENLPLFDNYSQPSEEQKIKPENCLTRGKVHDLKELYDYINRTFFKSELNLLITWGKHNIQRRSKSRRFGTFSHQKQLITIHPLLDNKKVPEFVIAFTIYHEALHSLQSSELRRPHNKEFRKYEKMYPEYEKVMNWREENKAFLFRGK